MDKLIESEEEEHTEPAAEAEPKEAARHTPNGGFNWPLRLVVILVAAGLIVGLVFLARWIYHLAHHVEPSKNPTTSQSQNKGAGKGGLSVSSGGSSKNGGSITLPGSNNNSQNNQTGNKSKSGKTTTLPNNGPGNVIGVFAAASFAAGALHYIVSLRKTAREN